MLKNLRSFSYRAKKYNFLFYVFLFCIPLVILVSCGKKPKNILAFDKLDKKEKKPLRIFYPTVKNIVLNTTHLSTKISWKPIEHNQLKGYNVYQFSNTTFIPKSPLNKKPVIKEEFTDQKPPKTYKAHYIVRAVFESNNILLEGPSSQIGIAQ